MRAIDAAKGVEGRKVKRKKREKSAQERKQDKRTDASFLKERVRRTLLDDGDGCMLQLHIARVCVCACVYGWVGGWVRVCICVCVCVYERMECDPVSGCARGYACRSLALSH